ncbi:uncharacterized protein LOC106877477 isoform X2 [Octopus bimaculoides]|uniref:uncharacterized protein LOC106877477 isoform X2 n=1 Tax=Octopus bimaculoides TaxID=37653 RepID=UPI00071CDBC0|nr:uncharacterized protein LOC106877477 isoform X2 [Octopus bimaculoides]|eukprot:XP_014781873.1 PREDICTED: uncharacterized protein LOC106877477 isoform X2 [Octopus bimaculoides]
MKNHLKCSKDSHPSNAVFSVSHLGLPQNIRSVFLASERYAMEYPLLRPVPPPSSARCLSSLRSLRKFILISIVSCMAVVTLTTMAILLVLSFQVSSPLNPSYDNRVTIPLPNIETGNRNQSDIRRHSTLKNSSFLASSNKTLFSSSISCYNKCWPYTAFRFQSECQNGVCHCQGKGYDPTSCLPIYKNCSIRRNSSNAVAYWHQKIQETFGCHSYKEANSERNSQVYVISTMNEWKAHQPIRLNVTEAMTRQFQPITLVLASYYPAHWFIQIQSGIHLSSILQISTVHFNSGRIFLNGKEVSKQKSLLTKQRSLVGYGDDRYSGHTIQLLQTVDRLAGSITSFSGSQRANFWTLDIS